VPTVPDGNDVVGMLRGAMLMVILRPADWVAFVGVCESVTVTVKLDVLAEVAFGVPEITPALLKLKPVGNLPAVRLHL